MKTWILILGICISPFTNIIGQDDENDRSDEIPIGTFKLALVAGLNAVQIDGDDFAGYNKLGLLAGAQVAYRTSDIWMPSVGIFYSQKGSRSDIQTSRIIETRYRLDYVEIPVLWNYIDGGVRISGGLAYGRLIGLDILINDIDETNERAPYYKNDDYSVVLGFGYYIDEHWGFDLRWTRSMWSIVDLDVGNIINQPQVNKFLSFRTIYQF